MGKRHWYFKNSSIKLYDWWKILKYFRYIWKYADWSVVILRISVTFLKYRHYICLFREDGQFFFLTESLKLARMSANIPALSLIIFVVISVSWHALKVSNFKISLWISSLFNLWKRKWQSWMSVAYFSYSEYALMVRVLYSILEQDYWYC